MTHKTNITVCHCTLYCKVICTKISAQLKHTLDYSHRRIGWLGTILLMLPIHRWVWLAARKPVTSVFNGNVPYYVLSGKLFSDPFNRIHAGSALDQPTIGKWLFWFTVMTLSSLPYAAAVRCVSNRRHWSGYSTFGLSVVTLCVCLLCILSWPLCWLIQYIHSMGFTFNRIFGLIYATGGGVGMIVFLIWAIRKQKINR
jgi:hypothetical protein